ncbi:MAG TPA: hypothetical protein ENG87_04390 [Candidatus Pacearchaeota archaeon]|nr:flagellar assembly protein J [archaeon BMS3Abin17]HDK42594.1 hypothetical protein [Candidatus Pacearchaeota archaeon]HDZ61398.1 hypothetical protein [Candidatus Pacearchaeota archaeon]
MRIERSHKIGFAASLLALVTAFFLRGNKLFFLILGLGILIGITPFVVSVINDTRRETEKEEMFLEFSRNLVESVKTGTPISKSIINIKPEVYGVLKENIEKLSNQISLGIPLRIALQVFSKDVNNRTISRSLTLIGQAEKEGGDIGKILESVADAVSISDKIKRERKAVISSLVVQGYIIFFVFMIIILVMQFKIIPMVGGVAEVGASMGGIGNTGGVVGIGQEEVSSSFMYLLLIQGFFSGLAIGKLAEGNIKSGIKHSFALTFSSFLISAVANIIFGG